MKYRLIVFFNLIFWVSSVFAQQPNIPEITAELVAAEKCGAPSKPHWIALNFTLPDGWHSYWKNPGDAGLSTKIKWTLPEEWKISPIQWPAPMVFKSSETISFGYKNTVVLPQKLEAPLSTPFEKKIYHLTAKAKWLICKNICIPYKQNLSLTATISDNQKLCFEKAQPQIVQPIVDKLPKTISEIGGHIEKQISTTQIILSLKTNQNITDWESLQFFPDHKNLIDIHKKIKIEKTSHGYKITLARSASDQEPKNVSGLLVKSTPWPNSLSTGLILP